jgi:methyltransferase (TIGR00027 family)
VARARFIEDLVAEQADRGVDQYVILGAGLHTFAQRDPKTASRLRVFEIDQPGPQAWKRRRLAGLALAVPDRLHLVPVGFEAEGASWLDRLTAAGFDPGRPAVIASTGVSVYLAKGATAATPRRIAGLAPGSPFLSFCTPDEMPALAREAGSADARHVSGTSQAARYFAHRTDGLRASTGEDLPPART